MTTQPPQRQLHYLPWHSEQIAVCATGDPQNAVASLVIIPPLLEEMNASRHLASQLAEELAQQGWFVVQFDLLGTGDSTGSLEQVQLQDWQSNVARIIAHTASQSKRKPHLLTVRSGALLQPDTSESYASILGWHPIHNGAEWYKPIARMKLLQPKLSNNSLIGGYPLPEQLSDALKSISTSEDHPAYYVASFAPEQAAPEQQIESPPFWLHHESPKEESQLWIKKSCDHFNQLIE